MYYHVYLFRKEVKETHSTGDFSENQDAILKFTTEQQDKLKSRLLRYDYLIKNEDSNKIEFQHKSRTAVQAVLYAQKLSFISGPKEGDLFEILMTASELTDTGEFSKWDAEYREWEEIE